MIKKYIVTVGDQTWEFEDPEQALAKGFTEAKALATATHCTVTFVWQEIRQDTWTIRGEG